VRLFTAIYIPEAWRDEAVAVRTRLANRFDGDLRFVEREQMHVTARFLGEVPPDAAAELTRAIGELSPPPVPIALGPAGTFGSPPRTAVVWLGVSITEDGARSVLECIDRAIEAAGLGPAADQPWRAHLTLARVRRQVAASRRRELAEAVQDLPVPASHATSVTTVSLFQSNLGNRAPNHKLLARSAVS
jgi:2'-5' RNA ligase